MSYRRVGPLEQCCYVIRWWMKRVFGRRSRRSGS